MCGSEVAQDAPDCGVCGYRFGRSSPSNLGGLKCARCGSPVEAGFDFCPICGQNQRERFARPDTKLIQVDPAQPSADRTVPAPGPGAPAPVGGLSMMPPVVLPAGAQVAPANAGWSGPPQAPPGGWPADRTVPAPSSSTAPYAGAAPAAALADAPADRTIPAPHIARPPVVGDDDRTVPAPGRSRSRPPADDAMTVPAPGRRPAEPIAVSPPLPGVPGPWPDENTQQGITTHGRSSPSNPVVGEHAREPSRTPTSPPIASARLVLVGRDGSEGERFAIVSDRLAIGRRQGDVRFPDDDFLSPTHARIERQGSTFVLFDAGSQNGVYLRIRGTASIYPGDTFMVGHQLLRVENVDGQVEEQPPDELGTRLFGTPLPPAWGKVVLVGRGGVRGDQFGLRGPKVVFGREAGDVLFPNDPFVSRQHARLRLELQGAAMAVFLEDLNSANGTYIRIRGSAELHHKDTFRIGDQIIRLRLD
jgi:pSer/pThr/pTyr-binding forkhead associated (FHA) protein